MSDVAQTVSLPQVLAVLRRNRLVIVLTVVLAAGAAFALSASSERRYRAQSQVAFNDESEELQVVGSPAAPNFQPDKLAAAEAERITRPEVVERVKERLRLPDSVARLQAAVTTQVEVDSNLVSITAEAGTAENAARLANTFARIVREDAINQARRRYTTAAREAKEQARRLREPEDAGRRAVYQGQAARLEALADFARPVDIVRSADVPTLPFSPKPVRNSVLAGLLGLLLGTGIAFIRHTVDRRLREPADVEGIVEAPVVGLLKSNAFGNPPVTANGMAPSGDEEVEQFRILRTNISFLAGDRGVGLILVTSPLPQEGKSTVASGLAWAEAMTGKRTLLVDCDLRRPTVAQRLSLADGAGLTDYLAGRAQPADILQTITIPNGGAGGPQLVCIGAGNPAANAAELLDTERCRKFLKEVSAVYDRVILDTAPLLPVSDTLALLPEVDAMLLCLRLGQTTRDEALAAKAALERFPTKPLGLVLTAADLSLTPYYVGSYAYARPGVQEVT